MTYSATSRRHLSSSPFRREAEPVIEQFAVDDHVNHDTYGVGRVLTTDRRCVTVDFRNLTARIDSPFHGLAKL